METVAIPALPAVAKPLTEPELVESLAKAPIDITVAIAAHPKPFHARHRAVADWYLDRWQTALDFGDLDTARACRQALRDLCLAWSSFDYRTRGIPDLERYPGETWRDYLGRCFRAAGIPDGAPWPMEPLQTEAPAAVG